LRTSFTPLPDSVRSTSPSFIVLTVSRRHFLMLPLVLATRPGFVLRVFDGLQHSPPQLTPVPLEMMFFATHHQSSGFVDRQRGQAGYAERRFGSGLNRGFYRWPWFFPFFARPGDLLGFLYAPDHRFFSRAPLSLRLLFFSSSQIFRMISLAGRV